jgi:hypothetical protein
MFLFAILAVFLAASPAKAASILVWSTGNGAVETAGVATWLQASGAFTSVTGVDADSMTLAALLAYDRVLYFSNSSGSQDPTAVGDVLADYADTGRRLVLSTFAFADQGENTLGGRIISEGISPFVVNGGSFYSNVTMLSNDGSAFFDGVNVLSGYYHDNVALSGGAAGRGTWSDGSPLLATKGNVVAVNLFPDDSFGEVGGDYRRLFVNALTAQVQPTAVPEPASILLVGSGVVGLVARARRRKKVTA